jgi:hypothetical protein
MLIKNIISHPVKTAFFLLVTLFLMPYVCNACEPVVPLVILFIGPSILVAVVAHSLLGLLAAITVKVIVFLWKCDEKNIKFAYYIVVANFYSLIPGIIIALFFSAPFLFIFIVPLFILFILMYLPAKNLVNYHPFAKANTWVIATILFCATLFTAVLWGFASDFGQHGSYIGYWLFKILCCIFAAGVSITLTILFEDAIINWLYLKYHKEKKSFIKPVVWANAAVFILIAGIGAALALPKRFASPDFILGALRAAFLHFFGG